MGKAMETKGQRVLVGHPGLVRDELLSGVRQRVCVSVNRRESFLKDVTSLLLRLWWLAGDLDGRTGG